MFEIILYSLVNMAPYIVFAIYAFSSRIRFSQVTTGISIGLVFAVQVLTRYMGTLDNSIYPVFISLTRYLSYFLFYAIVIKAHLGKKVFVLLIILNLSSFVSIGAHCLESMLFPSIVHHSYCWHTSIIMLFLELFITLPFLYYFLRYVKLILANPPVGKEWYYYWVIPAVFSFLWLYHVYGSSSDAADMISTPKTLIFLFIIHASGLLIYYLVVKLSNQLHVNFELERENHLLDIETLAHTILRERIEETRRSRHDLRHHILTMSDYLDAQDYDALKLYFNQFKATIPRFDDIIFCENRLINRLIFYFATQAQEAEIDFQVDLAVSSDLSIPEIDLSVLLGNLLENAIDACKEQKTTPKRIVISGRNDKHSFYFTIDNTYENKLKKNFRGEYISTKKNGSGIGIQSAKHVASKYNGVFTTEPKDHLFCTSVLLHL